MIEKILDIDIGMKIIGVDSDFSRIIRDETDRYISTDKLNSTWEKKRDIINRNRKWYAQNCLPYYTLLEPGTKLNKVGSEHYSKHDFESNEVFLKKMKKSKGKDPFYRKKSIRLRKKRERRFLKQQANNLDELYVNKRRNCVYRGF